MATDMYGLWDAGGVSGKEVLWTSGEGVGFPKAVKKVVVLLLPDKGAQSTGESTILAM